MCTKAFPLPGMIFLFFFCQCPFTYVSNHIYLVLGHKLHIWCFNDTENLEHQFTLLGNNIQYSLQGI